MPHRIFLPRKKHRSHALSIATLFAFNALFLTLIIFKVFSSDYKDFNVLGFATNINTEDLLKYTNTERKKYGLTELEISSQLSVAAKNKANDMFADNYWDHIAPDGKTPWDFINENGYSYKYAGENLAKDFMKSSSVVKAWMESPSHRENMLNEHYTEIGFAVVDGKIDGEETTLVVQMFGSPMNDSVKPETLSETDTVKTDNTAYAQKQDFDPEVLKVESQKDMIIINKEYLLYFAYAVLFFFFIALVIDGVLAYKSHHLRLTGNTISHLILFVSVLVFMYFINKPLVI